MQPTVPPANLIKRLKKGELLFSEGERSSSMYLVTSGAIRLFMRKGSSNVEVDTVRSGQILGELAFLDGNPRSLSGEALTPCELVEISGATFLETLAKAPEWLKILLKTVVGRLRTADARLRQLEAANQGIDYNFKPGGTGKRIFYQYLSWHEFMKVCAAIQLEALRAGKSDVEGVEVFVQNITLYAHSVFGVPSSKVDCSIEILENMNLATRFSEKTQQKARFKEIPFLDRLIRYLIEENRLEPSKRHQISERGLAIMKMIAPVIPQLPVNPTTGSVTVNLIEVSQSVVAAQPGEKGFRPDDVMELIQVGFMGPLQANSATEVLSTLIPTAFLDQIRFLEPVFAIHALNLQKSKVS